MRGATDAPLAFQAEDLPAGERILWRGGPDWRELALGAFHVPLVGLYFLVLAFWRVADSLHAGWTRSEAILYAGRLVLPALCAMALVTVLAWLTARATTFTLTDRRIVMRYGVALPAVLNIPLSEIQAMRVRRGGMGTADIALGLPDRGRMSFHQLWPYARPWRPYPAEPMLRALPDPDPVVALLTEALRKSAGARGLVLAAPASDQSGVAEPQAAAA